MKLYVDCEFNGHQGRLISMGIISLDKEYFYEVLDNWREDELVPWVKENVVPYLCKTPISIGYFSRKLRDFLLNFNEPLEIIADSPADFVYLMNYLHWMNLDNKYEMLELPNPVTFNLIRLKEPYKSAIPHNAIEDAIALMEQHIKETSASSDLDISLVSVYEYSLPEAANSRNEILYELLSEREHYECISHNEMPTFEKHCSYVESMPFREWFFITRKCDNDIVGTIAITRQDEIAISIYRKYRRKGYATTAIKQIIARYAHTRLLANINPNNLKSITLFEKLNFRHIQNTYAR